MRRAALTILFVLLFVTQKAAQDDDRADTTLNLGKIGCWRSILTSQAMLDRYLMILEASDQ